VTTLVSSLRKNIVSRNALEGSSSMQIQPSRREMQNATKDNERLQNIQEKHVKGVRRVISAKVRGFKTSSNRDFSVTSSPWSPSRIVPPPTTEGLSLIVKRMADTAQVFVAEHPRSDCPQILSATGVEVSKNLRWPFVRMRCCCTSRTAAVTVCCVT
jgi:hypothetical protein